MVDYDACKMMEEPAMFGAMSELVSTKYSTYYDYSLARIEKILLQRWKLLIKFRKNYSSLSSGDKMSYKFELEKNSICLNANLRSLQGPSLDLYDKKDIGCRKLTVSHFIKIVKFLQERCADDPEVQTSLKESLDRFTPLLHTNEYFLDISELYNDN